MSDSAIQTTPDPLPTAPPDTAPKTVEPALRRIKRDNLLLTILTPIASLRLTVWLFAFSIFLVLAGTLAQVDNGIWTVVNKYFRSPYVWIPFKIFFPRDWPTAEGMPGGVPYPGGWLLGSLLLINLLAAHAVRFKVSWKRSGILILHFGVIVMMLGELTTGLFAIEGNMVIEEGKSSNFLIHQDACELAIVDPSDPKADDVVVVPAKRLRKGTLVRHPDLPFDVEVHSYMVNSALLKSIPAGAENLATAGFGLKAVAVEKPEVTGTDPEQKTDFPASYVTFKAKESGETLGTYLMTPWLNAQPIKVDGKTYDVELRFKHTYKPYTMQLLHFTHDVYPGTEKPKDFASEVRLVDPSENESREVRIWMNHPFSYAGDTFYQQGFLPGDTGTILQVVRNPGWLMPYISCFLVAAGMLVHFGIKLIGFLQHALGEAPNVELPMVGRLAPYAIACLALLMLVMVAAPGHDASDQMQLKEFGKLPVLDGGRVKPIDSLARNALMVISGRQEYTDKDGKSQPAIKWLLDVMTTGTERQYASANVRAFHIDNEQVRQLLGLEARPGFLYAASEFATNKGDLDERVHKEMERVVALDAGQRTPADSKLLELGVHFEVYKEYARYEAPHKVFRIENDQVLDLLGLKQRQGLRYSFEEFVPRMAQFIQATGRARKIDEKQRDVYEHKIVELSNHVQLYVGLAQFDVRAVPPMSAAEEWKPLAERLRDRGHGGGFNDPAVVSFRSILVGYLQGNPKEFNRSLSDYQKTVEERIPGETHKAGFETFFNRFAPFYICMVLYVLAFLLACASFLLTCLSQRTWSEPLRRTSFWLLIVALAIHTWGLTARMYIQGRPPVTNLYSSAVFIGWGCVIVGLVLELVFRIGVGAAVAGVLGFLTAFIAHYLSLTGDTLEMMQAVLDTNFWLATHVTCITLGYTATFFAGFLGLGYLGLGILTPWLTRDLTKILGQMIYGVVCFAMFLSFTGTVLGGIWADQSWGRFWGWDPKENGALMIVMWNAVVLHARWGGMVKQRGMAVMTLFGNIVTAWSWFGVNMLGVGLHSYGFMSGALFWLAAFISSQLALIAVGMFLPQGLWLSSLVRNEPRSLRL